MGELPTYVPDLKEVPEPEENLEVTWKTLAEENNEKPSGTENEKEIEPIKE